jgi:hypothetical protein
MVAIGILLAQCQKYGDKLLERGINSTLLVKLEENASDVFRMLYQINRNQIMSITQVSFF